jgi:uncharacterized protein affecting Mg2+/Co2+ transport/cell wall assembly regulator SMI1
MDDLPDDALLLVLSFLSCNDLCSSCLIGKRFERLASSNVLWRDHLRKVWLLDVHYESMTPTPGVLKTHDPFTSDQFDEQRTVQEQNKITADLEIILNENPGSHNSCCKLLFKKWCLDYPGMSSCYARVKRMWNQLEAWLFKNTPEIYNTLLPGVPDQETVTDRLSKDAPIEILCSYRIRNGQRLVRDNANVGLLGGYSFYEYHANGILLDSETIKNAMSRYRQTTATWMKNVSIIAGRHNMNICVVTNSYDKYVKGQIIQFTRDSQGFVLAQSFTDWFERYVRLLTTDQIYDVTKKQEILRYPTSSVYGSDTTTRGVRIRCNALFIPEYSQLSPPNPSYFFAYRIRMSMDVSESASRTCRLTMRHWRVKDGRGNVDHVDGEGVVGYYPLMKPGLLTYSYIFDMIRCIF